MRPALSQTIVVAATAVLGVTLLWWSTPMIAASLAKAPAVAPLGAVHRGALVASDRLRLAIEALQASLGWHRDAEVLREMGLLQLILADAVRGEPDSRAALLAASAASSVAALEQGPASPHTWIRLAYADVAVHGATARTGELLAASIATGEAVPELTFARLDLLLQSWPVVQPEHRRNAGSLIRAAWHRDPVRLARLLHRTGSVAIGRLALEGISGAADKLDKILRREGFQ